MNDEINMLWKRSKKWWMKGGDKNQICKWWKKGRK
jgi:hypothetical protein